MPSKQEDKDPKVKTPKNRKSRRGKKNKNYKINQDSDSDSDWLPPTEHHSDSGSEEIPNEDMNPRELQKFIQKIFPSEAGKERLKQLEKIDNMIVKNKKSSKNKKKNGKKKTVKKKVESERKLLKKKVVTMR